MSAAQVTQERLAYEARTRPIYAAVAALAAVLFIGWLALGITGPHAKVDETTVKLIVESKRAGHDIVGAILQSIDAIAIAATLLFLLRAARGRNPNAPGWIRPVALVAAVLSLTAIAYAILFVHAGNRFVASGDQSYQEAQHVTPAVVGDFQLLGFLGSFLLALAIVLTSLQAMRVGLLTKFTGYLGIASGALIVVPTFGVLQALCEVYWLFALALVFSGRSPAGEPPAWSSGEAVPWPSSQALREQRIRGAGAGRPARGGGKAQRGPAPKAKAGGAEAVAAAGGEAERAGSNPRAGAKRKRKKRR